MNNLSSFKTIAAVLVFITLGLLAIQYLLFYEIRKTNLNISTIKNNLDVEEKVQGYLLSTQNTLDALSTDLENIDNSVIAKDDDVEFIEKIENMAKSNGLELKMENLGFEPNNFLDKSEFVALRVKANTTGSWRGTYNFLLSLESLSYRAKMNKFAVIGSPVISQDGKKKGVMWKSNFEMTILKHK